MNNNYPIQTSIEINNSDNYYIVFRINDSLYAINIKNIIMMTTIIGIQIAQSGIIRIGHTTVRIITTIIRITVIIIMTTINLIILT